MKTTRDTLGALKLLLKQALAACEGDEPESEPPGIPSTGSTPYGGFEEDLESSPSVDLTSDLPEGDDKTRAARYDFRAADPALDTLRELIQQMVELCDQIYDGGDLDASGSAPLAEDQPTPKGEPGSPGAASTRKQFNAMLRSLPPAVAAEMLRIREQYARG